MAQSILTNLNLVQNEIQNAVVQNLATAPASPKVGQIYFDTGIDKYRIYTSAGWVTGGDGGNADTLDGQDGTHYLARANHTGSQPASTISDLAAVVKAYRLDEFAAPTAALNLNSQKITALADPTNAGDAATKAYVDAAAVGLDVKDSVRAASTANIDLTTGGLLTIDGVALAAGNRVLVKNQTTASQNGIYVAASGAWARAADFDSSDEASPGAFMFVEEGTANADTGWVHTTDAPVTLGTTSLTFAQFSSTGSINAGAGLTKAGDTLDVGAGTGISVSADAVSIDTALVPRKFAATIGDGTATAFTVTHNLGTNDVQVQVYRNSTPYDTVLVDVERSSTNAVVVRFTTAPATGAFRVVVVG